MKIICAGTITYFDKHRTFLISNLILNIIPTLVKLPPYTDSGVKQLESRYIIRYITCLC